MEGEAVSSGTALLRLRFTGTAGGYFRVWIVNLFLTVITLGLYAGWAKVRTRRYFYGHTILDGHPFSYTAPPTAILRGYLIVGAGFVLYVLTRTYSSFLGVGVIAFFYGILPILLFQSLRFRARYSSYRNIRFRFLGTLGESYIVFLLIPLLVPLSLALVLLLVRGSLSLDHRSRSWILFLVPLSLGLIAPYWYFAEKRFFFRNFTFGAAGNCFRGSPRPFYRVCTEILILGTTAVVLAAFLILPSLRSLGGMDRGSADLAAILYSTGPMPIFLYLFFIVFLVFARQYLYARTTNDCLRWTRIAGIRFRGTLRAGRLFWIRSSNYLAIFLSLGLLIPWTRIRYVRYLLDNVTLVVSGSLDAFTNVAQSEESALGDVATHFFEFDIGL